ncbi:MAG: D-alanine--D-alanine ligase family protein [Bacillota bacterium]|nr:D-alanine--D-alanine ligase family protein [Bacillota bacterium]
MAEKALAVGVLYGGRSGEHEVSVTSARFIAKSLAARFQVLLVGISREGTWYWIAGEEIPPDAEVKEGQGIPLCVKPGVEEGGLFYVQGGEARRLPVDVVFPALHGPFGEDGTIQGLLEVAGLPYVGAGVLGSALGMDKIAQKDVFRARGIPTVRYRGLRREDIDQDGILDELMAGLGLPLFVKPANLGSSVGIKKAKSREELGEALSLAAQYDTRIIVEEAVQGREVECALLGHQGDVAASVVGEIFPAGEFYDYTSKYLDEGSRTQAPADLPQNTVEEIQALSRAAFEALDLSGLARVDFFVTLEGEVLVNEVNTIPGFTPISMYPQLWEKSGMSSQDLVDRLVRIALHRHQEKLSLRHDPGL